MRKKIWLFLLIIQGIFGAAVAQKHPQVPFHGIEDIFALGKKGMAIMFTLISILVGLGLARLFFVIWRGSYLRRERRLKRRSIDPDHQLQLVELRSKISLLESNNKRLRGMVPKDSLAPKEGDIAPGAIDEGHAPQLEAALQNVRALASAIRGSVAFDREKIVIGSAGHESHFVFEGCEINPDKPGYLGHYGCAACSERVSIFDDNDVSDEPFREHVTTCLGMTRAMGAS